MWWARRPFTCGVWGFFVGGLRRALLAAAAASAVLADMNTYDCKMKQLGLDFVQTLQPFRPMSNFQVRPGVAY